jgi:hypothetical protein
MDLARHIEDDDTPAAPGSLEVIQRFLNLHEHGGREGDRPPSAPLVREFLVDRGLLAADASYDAADHAAALEFYEALHERLRAQDDDDEDAARRRVEDLARRASFRLRFDDPPALEPTAAGIEGAIGRLLALLFLAELDGSWGQMKECASHTCTAVFYDRSKNHSGKWCSMQTCGNKHKVRAWRERHREGDPVGSHGERERSGVGEAEQDAVDA